jgi:hypothetical protein
MEQALAYHRAPALLSGAQARPLPEGVITLLRLAGGDQALARQCAEASGETEAQVLAAATFFIQQVMFAPGGDSYRVLGVEADADDTRIKEHYRWLVRWLHPDRNTDDWDNVYADRVNVAWQDLRLPDRRAAYDQARRPAPSPDLDEWQDDALAAAASAQAVRPATLDLAPARFPRPAPEPALAVLSPNTVQKLPTLVLGGLGGVAAVLLVLAWLAGDPPPVARVSEAPRATPAAEASARLIAEQRAREVTLPAPTPAYDPVPDPLPEPLEPAPRVAEVPRPAPTHRVAEGPMPAPTLRVAEAPPVAAERAAPLLAPAPAPALVTSASIVTPPPPNVAAVEAPAAAGAAEPTVHTAAPTVHEADAQALLRRFSAAYAAGDINALMRLFTRDARNQRGGRDAIVFDYQSLFSASEARELRLTPSGWMPREQGATLLANYEARVQASGRRRPEVSRGEIRFDIRLENDEPRISLVSHD